MRHTCAASRYQSSAFVPTSELEGDFVELVLSLRITKEW
jgi:hypothetical protein